MSVDPARRAAEEVVERVATTDAYANLLLPAVLGRYRLAGRDAAFATELAYGTLRWQGSLDAVLAVGANRPLADLQPPVLAVLRLGAYQLLRLRVPPHAAVASSVELVRAVAGARPAGLVNAVLRRAGERDWAGWVDRLTPQPGRDRLAFAHGYPAWVVDAYAAALGAADDDDDELAAALAADRPVTHLAALPGRVSRDALAAASGGEAGPYSPYAVRLTAGGDPARLPAVTAGAARVQDEGSQLAALGLLWAADGSPTGRWLDLCAGPGGKAALLASAGVPLLAAELQPHRARLVAGALAGTPGRVVQADGRVGAWRDGAFDRVLLDAPCTGLGALRRRPELRWRRRADDADRLAGLQRELLHAALRATGPGGLLAYVTCSPHPAETTGVLAAVLPAYPDVEPLDTPRILGVPDCARGLAAQLWAHRHGTDAMFIALLRRG